MDFLLETERLIIRKLNLNDIDLLFKYSQEKITKKELPDEVFDNIEETKDTVSHFISNYNHKYPLVYGIVLKNNDTLIGHLSLSKIDKGIEIGYAIATDYQNYGYASEVLALFPKWAKLKFGIEKIYGIVKRDNVASWKVLEKNGFIFEEEGIYKNYFGGKYQIKIYYI